MKSFKKFLIAGSTVLALATTINFQASAQTKNLDVAASVDAASCSFGTFSDVDFGQIPITFSNDKAGSGLVRITCTASVTGVDVKIEGDTGSGRSLKKDGTSTTDTLLYQLFRPTAVGAGSASSGTPWQDGVPFTADLSTTETEIAVHGSIFASNAGATAGAAYSDQVVVELAL